MTRAAVHVTSGLYLRLVLLGAALTAVTLILLAGWQLMRARAASEQRLHQHASRVAERVGHCTAGIAAGVDGMCAQMATHLRWGEAAPTQPLAERLRVDAAGWFDLDQLPPTVTPGDSGNCTGRGDPRALPAEQRAVLDAALALNPWYTAIRGHHPYSAWCYVLAPSFIHIFPYRPSSEYHYRNDTALYQQEFWTRAQSETNRDGTGFWTSAYIDGAGLGLMVTRAKPLRSGDRTIAVVAVDMTLDAINRLVAPPPGGGVVLINGAGQILACPGVVASQDKAVAQLDALLIGPSAAERARLLADAPGKLLRGETHTMIRSQVVGTDWSLLAWRPHSAVWADALDEALPFGVLMACAIGLLLIGGIYYMHRRFVRPAQLLLSRIDDLSIGRESAHPDNDGPWADWLRPVEASFADRARLVQELQVLNSGLERLVAERTADLAASRDESQRRAGALEEALRERERLEAQLIERETLASLGRLVAGVAHEINSPLSVAMASAEHVAVAVRKLDEGIAAHGLRRSALESFRGSITADARLLAANLGRAAELVRSFKQVSVDRVSGARRQVDLGTYLPEVLASLGGMLRRHRLDVQWQAEGDLSFLTEPGSWAQILTNLVENAGIHAYEAGGPLLVRCERRDGRMILTVRDHGRGLADDVRGRVFQPFATTRRHAGGTGLGLHLVFNLAAALGGEASWEDAQPGLRVRISVPV